MRIKILSRDVWMPALLLTLTLLGVTSILATRVERENVARVNQASASAAQLAAELVVQALTRYQYGLRGARGAITVLEEQGLTREKFRRYSLTRDIDVEFPGALGFGYVRRVTPSQQVGFLAAARADGMQGFTVRQLQSHAGDKYVIQYIEPIERNGPALGLDIASEARRRDAAEAAMRKGTVQLTAPITLVQATGQTAQSFLILLPVYRDPRPPGDVAGRETNLLGWVYAPLSSYDMLSAVRLASDDARVVLEDITDSNAVIPFYRTGQNGAAAAPPAIAERNIYGRRWRLRLEPLVPFVAALELMDPRLFFVAGTILSIFTGLFYGVQRSSSLGRQRLSVERSKLAAIVDSSLDGIIGKDPDGIVRSWNMGAEKIFGLTAKQAIGRSLLELIVPKELHHEEYAILARIAKGEVIPHFETIRRHYDGTSLPVSVSIAPIRDPGGRIIGASKTVRDISELIEARDEIIKLNDGLERQVAERTQELASLSTLQHTILNNAAHAVIATDTEGVITLFNPAAEAMLGYREQEMIGKLTPAQFHLGSEVKLRAEQLSLELGVKVNAGFEVFVARARIKQSDENEWTYIRKNGTRIPVLLSVSALRDELGVITGFLGMALDISRQHADTMALKLLGDHFKKAAEVAELGIWGWNLIDNTLEWNERMFEIYSAPLSLLENGQYYEYWRACVHPDDIVATESLLQAAMEGRANFDITFRVVIPEAPIRHVHAAGIRIFNENGTTLRMVGINRDITIQLEHERTLSEAKIAADAASAAKSAFLANMSHEIRSPMHAILGMLQLLRKTKLNDCQFDYADKAAIAARSLLGILNDILDFSKVEEGKLTLDVHPMDLDLLLREIGVILSANIGSKEVEVLFDIDSELPHRIMGDALRLQQILLNLTSNAIKFCHQGEIILSARTTHDDNGTTRLAISVSDTGIGIAPEHLEHIFEGFSQAETSTSRRFGGTGLGLAICRRLVGLMGGSLTVHSQLGVGSTFSFDVPCIEAASSQTTSVRVLGLQCLRVLVCDDNASARQVLANIVTSFGWRPEVVASGKEALDELTSARDRGNQYDVILIDWIMPGLNGWQTAVLLREMLPYIKIPVIVMVAGHGRELLSQCQSELPSVLNGILVKPITASALFDCVANARAGQEAPIPNPVVRNLTQTRLAGVRLLVVEDNVTNQQVARDLLGSDGANVTVADHGEAALALLEEFKIPPFDLVLMDVQMPGMDGYQTTREIRSRLGLVTLPIIAMTANAMNSDREAALAAGMNDHVGKPFDLDYLIDVIRKYLGYSYTKIPIRSTIDLSLTSREYPILFEAALSRFGENKTIYMRALQSFIVNSQELKKALIISHNIANEDESKILIHTLKGLSATIGAEDITRQLSALESTLILSDESIWISVANAIDAACDAAAHFVFDNTINVSSSVEAINAEIPRSELEKLAQLLCESNMDAIKFFENLRNKLNISEPDLVMSLELAISQLNFPAALDSCSKILQKS